MEDDGEYGEEQKGKMRADIYKDKDTYNRRIEKAEEEVYDYWVRR